MYKVPWHVEILAYKRSKGVICRLVGMVGTPVRQGFYLMWRDRVGEKRRVVPLYCQQETIPLTNDVRLHTIASEDAL